MGEFAVVYEHRCKICKLSRTHPQMFELIHNLIINDQVSHTQTCKIINAKAKDLGLIDWVDINHVNMAGHFRYHVTMEDTTAMALAVARPYGGNRPSLANIDPQAASTVESMVHRRIGTEVRDFDRIEDIYEDLVEKLSIISSHINEIKDAADAAAQKAAPGQVTPSPVNVELMKVYSKLVTEARSTITDINKMRQGGRLVTTVIESLLKQMLFEMLDRLATIYSSHADALRTIGVDETSVLKYEQALKIASANMLGEVARSATDEVLRNFKIKK